MKTIIFFLILSILFEASLTTLPLVLVVILFSAVVLRRNIVFALAFISGLFLDLLSLGQLGITSLYLTCFVLIIFLYQKKFEINNLNFILVFTFIGSILYLWLQSANYIILQSITISLISGISFFVYKLTETNKSKENTLYGPR